MPAKVTRLVGVAGAVAEHAGRQSAAVSDA